MGTNRWATLSRENTIGIGWQAIVLKQSVDSQLTIVVVICDNRQWSSLHTNITSANSKQETHTIHM